MIQSKYIGQSDRIRIENKSGDDFVQKVKFYKREISRELFLKFVDPKPLLDDGETFEQWTQGDPEHKFYVSYTNDAYIYFIQHSGFEFLFRRRDDEVLPLTFNQRLERAGIETIRDNKITYLKYNGLKIPRPDVSNIEITVVTKFEIEV